MSEITLDRATREALVREIRLLGITSFADPMQGPPPHDVVAEERLVSEAMWGAKLPDWFDPEWCYMPLHRAVLGALSVMHEMGVGTEEGKQIPIDFVARIVEGCGFRSQGMDAELTSIAYRCTHTSIDEECRTIRKLHFRRRSLERVLVLSAMLRQPEATDEEISAASALVSKLITESTL